jgi:hypothetical protein
VRGPSVGCWECSQRDGHGETGGVHQPWHCKPDLCPERAKHAERVYAGRFERRVTSATRDGVIVTDFIDGRASERHRQSRCICGLLLIWTPTANARSEPPQTPPIRPADVPGGTVEGEDT